MFLFAFVFAGLGNGLSLIQQNPAEVYADTATSTLTFTSACGGSGTADDEAVWTVASDAAESSYDGTKGIHYGTGSKAVSYLTLTTSDISGTITEIVVNASGASGTSAKLNVTVGGSAFGTEKSLTSSAANYTLTGSASGEIVISLTQSSAQRAIYCKSIVVTYDGGGVTPTPVTPSTPAATYYSPWVEENYLRGKTGLALAQDVHHIMWETTNGNRVSYTSLNDHLQETDEDPANADYLLDFWTGSSLIDDSGTGVWNKEHVWPAANSGGAWARVDGKVGKSQTYAGSDIHHIRPTSYLVNTSRGNKPLGIVDKTQEYSPVVVNGVTSGCLNGVNSSGVSVFEPEDDRKGDVARIYFYLYLTYSSSIKIGSTTSELNSCSDIDSNYADRVADLTAVLDEGALIDVGTDYASSIDMLLAWNDLDPVDAVESQRNEVGYTIQKNRNPFVDFPELATFIFQSGNFYDLAMDDTQRVLLGSTFASTVRTMPSSWASDVEYELLDDGILSLDGTTFTAEAAGTTIIEASITEGGITYSDTTTIEVLSPMTSITLSVSSYTLTAGKSFTPIAYSVPSNAYDRGMVWSSSNSSIAEVVDTCTGKIKAVSAGNCSIVVTSTANASVYATLALTVTAPVEGLLDIELSDFDNPGASYAAYGWSSGGIQGTGFIYKSSCMQFNSTKDGAYIRNGNGYPLSSSITKIILYSSDTESTDEATFELRVSSSAIASSTGGTSAGSITVPSYGGSASLEVNINNATYFDLELTSSGAARLSRICIIYGDPDPTLESLSLDYSSMKRSYSNGEPLDVSNLVVTAVYNDASTKVVTGSCAFSPANGAVLTPSDGAVTVSYTEAGVTLMGSITITVSGSSKTVTGITMSPASFSLQEGQTQQLTVTASYDDSSSGVVTAACEFIVDDETIATISDSGLVTAVSAGTTTIISSYAEFYGESTITVTAAPSGEGFVVECSLIQCAYGDESYVPSYTATYNGVDVKDQCTLNESLMVDGHYRYYKSIGEKGFEIQYETGGHTYEDLLIFDTTNVGAEEPSGYTLVTSTSQLSAGSTYIIASDASLSASTYVMSTEQRSSNRGSVAYTDAGTNFQVLTLGGSSGAWTLSPSTGNYLYASSTSGNQLKTRANNDDDKSRWVISFPDSETNEASIVAVDSEVHGTVRFNSGNNPRIFSCYSATNTMAAVYLYKVGTASGDEETLQATALKNYLDEYRTCAVLDTETTVKRLALEYNALFNADTKATFASLSTSTTSGDSYSTGCYSKLYYIVQKWNTNHPNDLVYLYTSDKYEGIDNGGTGTKVAPMMLVGVNGIGHAQESSPLTTTLWIVVGSGSGGIVLIAGAYFVSKKKKRYQA